MTILDQIGEYKRREVAERRAARPLAEVERAAASAPPVRDFAAALTRAATNGPALIAEIKKASPSKGLIRADFSPPKLACAYAEGGAACLSVLTDGPSFHGADGDLVAARAAVDLPVLRKEFFYDPYQVVEARALGADCVLLIMAALSDAEAAELQAAAADWSLATLLEVHDERELDRALKVDGTLIGINNRDLRTFRTDLDTTVRLAPRVPQDRAIVAESGLSTPADLARLEDAGVKRFLVGEHLMRQRDVAAATRALLAPLPADHA